MTQEELDKVLELHKKWLDGDSTGRIADLRDADFRNATLRGADLSRAKLRDADIDFSVWPLWCGGLDVHIDDRIAIQLLYHLVRNVLYSKNTSEELKNLLSQKEIVTVANQFHRVDECGRIGVTEQCQ